ncbi:hypothetical protein SK128_010852 [Halocaridina rubra]|uniref:Uncharacterized protein n=1 Tax=Halocaridina rubra TaxID=373956 RepID=A0AAN8WS12_HALRR
MTKLISIKRENKTSVSSGPTAVVGLPSPLQLVVALPHPSIKIHSIEQSPWQNGNVCDSEAAG